MSQPLQRNLNILIRQIVAEQGLSSTEADIFLDQYIETTTVHGSGKDEAVRIKRGPDGDIILRTSLKLPNLRFRLKDLLFEAALAGSAIFTSQGWSFAQVMVALGFLREVRRLSKIEISHEQAVLLIAIFKLTKLRKQVTVDLLQAALESDGMSIDVGKVLLQLETLKCIETDMDVIRLNETIYVTQE